MLYTYTCFKSQCSICYAVCYVSDEAMQLMVTKILELSSQKPECLPEDFVDLGTELGNNSNRSQMRGMASKSYSQSGNGITLAIRPKPHADKSVKKSGSTCC